MSGVRKTHRHMRNLIFYISFSGCFICIAWLLLKSSWFYQKLFKDQAKSRFETIDGLRGFLALAVFVHHAVISQQFFRTGLWELTKEYPLYHFATTLGVSLFFMITGFLFWTKVLVADGKLNTINFFNSRISRLAPLYVFHTMLVIIIAFAVSDFALLEPPSMLAKNVLSWLAFGILGQPDINQVKNTFMIDAGVVWTLAYEWAFYCALPLMACFHKGRSFLLILSIIFSYGLLVPEISSITLFAYGMIAAYLVYNFGSQNFMQNRWFALIGGVLLLLAYQVSGQYHQFQKLLFFLFFMLVVYGNPFFGILTSLPAKLLGTISYSIYLLQGAVLFIVLHFIDRYYTIAGMDPLACMVSTALCGIFLIILSANTYRFIEYPFLVRKVDP